MIGKSLVRALEEDWRSTIDAVLRARRWPTTSDVAKLGAAVAKLSRAYNDASSRAPTAGDASDLAARLGFSFARDAPKSAGAVRELIATGALAMPIDRALRVLDVGAGLGASTWGLARAFDAVGARGAIDATWIDADRAALEVGQAIVRARHGAAGTVALRVDASARTAQSLLALSDERFDVVLLGQVLSELDRAASDADRVTFHARFVGDLVTRALRPDGALVIIEPALRDRTRHLHRVRDALLTADNAPTVFAPCLHASSCPALANEGDWCHEDLAVDLPPWLAPVARAAGLRWQGLTFSYLVLRRDARTLGSSLDAMAPNARRLRVVSNAFTSKGKSEAFLCGELANGATRARVMRLDRERDDRNEAWGDARRGDVLEIDPAPDPAKPRVGRDSRVRRL